jgi:hypothetical protein
MTNWTETVEGPDLAHLLHRLTECPPDFLSEPMVGEKGAVDVVAVVSDLLCDLGALPIPSDTLSPARSGEDAVATRNRLRLVLVAAWLLSDPWFVEHRVGTRAEPVMMNGLVEMAGLVQAERSVTDPDRREELVRTCLFGLGLRPGGESPDVAQDRLTTLSSAERVRVVQAARAAEERARQIREELARKAAQEAAASYSPE